MKIKEINYDFLGKLFVYYRHQKNLSRNDIKDIILKNTNEDISTKTIQRIESGEYSRLINIYDNIAHVLGFEFIENETALFEVNELSKDTCNIINSGKPIREYIKLLEHNRDLLDKYQNYLYLSVLLRINIATLECYLNDNYPDEEIIYLLKDSAFSLKNEVFDMAMYLLFCISRHGLFDIAYKDILLYGKSIINKKISLLDKLSYYLFYFDTSFDIYNFTNKEYSRTDQNDYYQMISYHNIMSLCKINLKDYVGAIAHTNFILEDKEKAKELLPRRFLYQTIKRKGTVSYFADDHASCFECLSLVAKNLPKSLGFNIIFLCKSAEATNNISSIVKILQSLEVDRTSERNIHAYFLNKYSGNILLKTQENMIIKNILPALLSAGSTKYIDIFHDEMRDLVKVSCDYDKLIEYEEMVKREI